MTIEELLECSADQLEAMSDEQLCKYFASYLNVTRPELVTRPEKDNHKVSMSGSKTSRVKDDKMARAQAILDRLQINLKIK